MRRPMEPPMTRPTLAAWVRARRTRRRRRAAEQQPAASPTRTPATVGLAGLYSRQLLPDPPTHPAPRVGRRELWEDLYGQQ
jgi:hypothetical protein